MTSSCLDSDSLDKRDIPSTYQRYVGALCSRNPSLQNLHHFLAKSVHYRAQCRLSAFDFREDLITPVYREIQDVDFLRAEFGWKSSDSHWEQYGGHVQGRIIVIEDLTPDIITLLGSDLDIDPRFFAMHLHTAQRSEMRRQTPQEATLPSRLNHQPYINTAYHRSVQHEEETPAGGRLLRDTVIDRKLVFLPHTKIALAQQCVSVLKVNPSDDFWLAIVLVDPPIGDTYFMDGQKHKRGNEVHLPTQPYLGDYEDFLAPPKFSESRNVELDGTRRGMFEDMHYYWRREMPPGFNSKDPTLSSLAYFPLKIVAAEWSRYITVMHNCIKQYEYQSDKLPDLAQFDTNLYELQSWRRRSLNSQQKLRNLKVSLNNQKTPQAATADPCIDLLLEDYEFVLHGIIEAGQRLENMLPVVTSLVQIADARHSFAETANISRLTILALIFVPLSFVSSLFSMNSNNAPGSKYFWVYFVVAIPVTFLVFLVARPPRNDIVKFWRWLKARRLKKQRPPVQSSLKRAMTDVNMAAEKGV